MGNGVSIQSEITKPVDCSDLKSDCDARAEVYRLRKLMRDNQQLIISANTGGRLTSINTNVPPSSANKGISSKGTPTSIKSPTNVDFSRFDRDGNKDFKLANAPSLYDYQVAQAQVAEGEHHVNSPTNCQVNDTKFATAFNQMNDGIANRLQSGQVSTNPLYHQQQQQQQEQQENHQHEISEVINILLHASRVYSQQPPQLPLFRQEVQRSPVPLQQYPPRIPAPVTCQSKSSRRLCLNVSTQPCMVCTFTRQRK
mmetsp:Transcript_44412/g.56862  ORF Transcript_44412/g.56862 Transcript_44412/m.56862 type:complete len:255 (+) Transcript_44412:79-843(+)